MTRWPPGQFHKKKKNIHGPPILPTCIVRGFFMVNNLVLWVAKTFIFHGFGGSWMLLVFLVFKLDSTAW